MKSSKNNKIKLQLRRLLKFSGIAAAVFVVSSVLFVTVYKFIDPPFTPIMVIRIYEGWFDGRNITIHKDWVDYNEISPNFFKAVIASEDGKFFQHSGFDWQAIERAYKYNKRHKGRKKQGASTISMQTAKNVFLWHGRVYLRKALEAYFTVLIEWIWGKQRILEVYANVIEFGEGIYGVEEAAERFFGTSAANLSPREAVLLTAVLPNPRRWSPDAPTNYIRKRAATIRERMRAVHLPRKK